jgi:hypothetical protein
MPLSDRKAGATNYPLNKILKIRFALVVCFISIFSLNNSDDLKSRASKIIKNKKELLKYMEDISFLGGLFDVEIKLEPMPIQIDIRKTLFYKWGERKGFERGLKEAISGIIQAKFGSQKVKLIKNILDKIDDINYLKKIKKEAIRAKTWEDFIKILKNPNSKSKNSKEESSSRK